MTDHDPRELELERELATLTEWNGPTPDLWREALHEASSGGWWQTVMTFGATRLRPTHLLAASLLVIVTIGIVYGLATPDAPSRPEYAASMAKDAASTAAPGFASPPALRRSALIDDSSESSRYGLGSEADLDTNLRSGNGGGGMRMRSPMASPDSGTSGTGSGALPGDRRVVRTVTVELRVEDVRVAFLKAQHVISPARSEYVEASSLSGEAERARGSLTLRVEASRLSDVLNALHELGVVHAEQASGEDVTDQVIDIEARLRNEQRIETELLELLDRRDNAPLEDVMALRDRIAMVRSTIERLVARRDGLDRLVSLATVLVIIAPNDDAPAPEPETTSIGDYFGAALASGWDRSLRTLADSLGGAMRFIIGGLLWWTIAVGALLVAHAALRRRVNAASSR